MECLHLSSIAFDKSRAMIRKIERAAPIPMGFFVPSTTPTSDWTSFSESMVSTVETRRLHLKEIAIEGTRWTSELCESLIRLVERIDESTELTLRVQLPVIPEEVHGENLTGQDPFGEQLELFARFLEVCGAKIDRLDVCLVSPARGLNSFERELTFFTSGKRRGIRSTFDQDVPRSSRKRERHQ